MNRGRNDPGLCCSDLPFYVFGRNQAVIFPSLKNHCRGSPNNSKVGKDFPGAGNPSPGSRYQAVLSLGKYFGNFLQNFYNAEF